MSFFYIEGGADEAPLSSDCGEYRAEGKGEDRGGVVVCVCLCVSVCVCECVEKKEKEEEKTEDPKSAVSNSSTHF